MRLDWFAHRYTRWTGWKDQLLAQVRASLIWRTSQMLTRHIRRQWMRWTQG
jgi:hypothetical protein